MPNIINDWVFLPEGLDELVARLRMATNWLKAALRLRVRDPSQLFTHHD